MKSTGQHEQTSSVSDVDLAQRLAACARQSEAAARELHAFGAILSHDLRAPLRNIEGFSRLLLQTPYVEQFDETGLDYLQRIYRASLRLALMMDETLQLTRLGQGGIKSEQVDLTNMALDIFAALKATAPSRLTEILVEPDIAVKGDSLLLRLMLENLIGNAWKFTRKSDVARINLSRTNEEGVPAICLRDNGIGFEQRYTDRLFRPFSRLHSDTEFEGMGVGLAKVQRVVHAHGGRVWASAQYGVGAVFYFTLPGMTTTVRTGIDSGCCE